MKVDPRVIEPFNEWWRSTNHCEPSPEAVTAFAAGFKAGLQRGVDEMKSLLNGDAPQHDEQRSEKT